MTDSMCRKRKLADNLYPVIKNSFYENAAVDQDCCFIYSQVAFLFYLALRWNKAYLTLIFITLNDLTRYQPPAGVRYNLIISKLYETNAASETSIHY